jgi:small conductance mechanosensitive channel
MSFTKIAGLSTGLSNITVGDLFSAAITLLVSLLVLKFFVRVTSRVMEKGTLDDRVQKYVLKGLKFIGYVIIIILVIERLGVNSSSLVALLSVGSLGVTLAAEDILGNVAGGLVILSSKTFALGDFIETNGVSGTVEEITLNHTKLLAPDGTVLVIPNKAISAARFTNFTALGKRRVSMKINASYDAPTEKVKRACMKAMEKTGRLLDDPAPTVHLTAYNASSIEYSVFCWCATADFWDVTYDLAENLRTAFDESGVDMTYDHLNIHVLESHEK